MGKVSAQYPLEYSFIVFLYNKREWLMVELSGMTIMYVCHRWCKRPIFCGNEYIQEVAYCYIEGSFCQRWIYRQIQQQTDEENEGELNITVYYNKECFCKTYLLMHDIWSFVYVFMRFVYYRKPNISHCVQLCLTSCPF